MRDRKGDAATRAGTAHEKDQPRLPEPATCERITVQLEKKVSWNYQSRAMSLTETWSIPPGTSDLEIERLRDDRINALGKVMRDKLPAADPSAE